MQDFGLTVAARHRWPASLETGAVQDVKLGFGLSR